MTRVLGPSILFAFQPTTLLVPAFAEYCTHKFSVFDRKIVCLWFSLVLHCTILASKGVVDAFLVYLIILTILSNWWHDKIRDAEVRFGSVLPEFRRTQNRTLRSVREILPNVEPDHQFRFRGGSSSGSAEVRTWNRTFLLENTESVYKSYIDYLYCRKLGQEQAVGCWNLWKRAGSAWKQVKMILSKCWQSKTVGNN